MILSFQYEGQRHGRSSGSYGMVQSRRQKHWPLPSMRSLTVALLEGVHELDELYDALLWHSVIERCAHTADGTVAL